MKKKRIIIAGAGPAGLTFAYDLLKKSKKYEVIIFEESDSIGGIAKTINYKGNRIDIGGHRFFTKEKVINDLWEEILPISDDTNKDNILLKRKRVSRILSILIPPI